MPGRVAWKHASSPRLASTVCSRCSHLIRGTGLQNYEMGGRERIVYLEPITRANENVCHDLELRIKNTTWEIEFDVEPGR